jgi:hypothetical protein
MKFEFIQFGLFGSFLFNSIFVYPAVNLEGKDLSSLGNHDVGGFKRMTLGCLSMAHFLQLVMVYLLISVRKESLSDKAIMNYRVIKIFSGVGIAFCYLVFYVILYLKWDDWSLF